MKLHCTIFYAVRHIGGAQLLFARMAEQLVARHGWKVRLIDLEDGFIRAQFLQRAVQHEFTPWEPGQKVLVGDSVLLLGFGELPEALRYLQETGPVRVVLWSIAPHNVLAYFRLGFVYHRLPAGVRQFAARTLEPRRWRRNRALFTELRLNHSLAQMDGTNATFPRSMGLECFDGEFLPVPVSVVKPAAERADGNGERSVGWLGRLSDDKVNSIQASAEWCSWHAIQAGITVDYHVIGTGEALVRLQNIRLPGVRFIYAGELRDDALAHYIRRHFRVGFAMGTSLLEIAKLGVPTVITDYSRGRIPREQLALRWLFQAEDCSLAEVVGEQRVRVGAHIKEIFAVMENDDLNREIGRQCFDYVVRWHDMTHVSGVLDRRLRRAGTMLATVRAMWGAGFRPWGQRMEDVRRARQNRPTAISGGRR